jgi:hypothetical protein
MAGLMLLRRMGRDDLTAHGFRSTFRDWCGEATATPRELTEAALYPAPSPAWLASIGSRFLYAGCARRLMIAASAYVQRATPRSSPSNVSAEMRRAA